MSDKKTDNFIQNDELITFGQDCQFLKFFHENSLLLCKELTCTEIATLVFLTDFICYDDCILRKNGDKRGKILSISDLATLKESKYDTLRKTIYSLRQKNVIGIHKKENKKVITVNPFIFVRGSYIKKWVYDYYSDSVWAKNLKSSINRNTPLKVQLRKEIIDWKKASMTGCNYACVITGEKFKDVHHLTPFQNIFIESLLNVGLDERETLVDYSDDEYMRLRDELIRLHNKYGLGVCLNAEVHRLFHKTYGYVGYTKEDFFDFVNRIFDGEFNDWFEEKNIPININYEVINNIFGVEK